MFILYLIVYYSFALSDCEARGENQTISLYDGTCPTSNARFLNVIWNDYESFDVSVFKIGTSHTIVFACTVRVFWDQYTLPSSCVSTDSSSTRRRREQDEFGEGTVFQ